VPFKDGHEVRPCLHERRAGLNTRPIVAVLGGHEKPPAIYVLLNDVPVFFEAPTGACNGPRDLRRGCLSLQTSARGKDRCRRKRRARLKGLHHRATHHR
jgi:hypothetical protein